MSFPPPVLPATSSPSPPVTPGVSGPAALARRAVRDRPVAIAALAVLAATGPAALASALDPALGPAGHPHATLHGTLGEALSIFATNGRLLIVPFLLVVGRWPSGRVTRPVGDLIVAALIAVNAVTIGLALGRFPASLLPYLPHLPLEDAALATAVGAWLSRRLSRPPGRPPRTVRSYAAWTGMLTAAAALSEAFLVPHAT